MAKGIDSQAKKPVWFGYLPLDGLDDSSLQAAWTPGFEVRVSPKGLQQLASVSGGGCHGLGG